MQAINQHPQYAEAQHTLTDLVNAHRGATEAESRILGLLAEPDEGSMDPLQAGLRLLRGEAAQRKDVTGLSRELAEVRERLEVLRQAIEGQRAVLASLTGDLSAEVCAAAAPDHDKTVEGVLDALLALRGAMAAEAAVRAAITDAGYRCTLEAVTTPELNFDDVQSAASRMLKDVRQRIKVDAVRKQPSLRVRHLVALAGGYPGDVVTMKGSEAAPLLKQGLIEVTTDKVGKAPRPLNGREVPEMVLS